MDVDGRVSVSMEDLRREFGRIVALDDLTVALEAPGIVVRNGSGTTTLIRCLLEPTTPASDPRPGRA